MNSFDATIIGAGPAGSAAAIALARGGARAVMLERSRETGDALCGGFLSWQTLERLAALGIDRAALGGQRVTRVRLFAGRQMSETMLPAAAMGVSRHRLDTLLQAAAARAGTAIERGVHATAFDTGAIEAGAVLTRDGARLTAPTVFLATGKHGFRGFAREAGAWQRADPVMGLRLRMPDSPALARMVADAIELHLFDRGYAGLVRHEDGSANLCLAVHKSRLDAAGGDPAALLRQLGHDLPHLGERLAHADWTRTVDAIGHVPYGWRARTTARGLFRLGDQAGVIPSLAGEGIGLALASAEAAATAWRRDGPPGAEGFQRGLAARMARPFAIASLVWRLGENPAMAGGMTRIARHLPSLVRWISQATRLPHG